MVSFPFHRLAAILGRGGFLPRTPDTVGWNGWILSLAFLWVALRCHTRDETKQKKLEEPIGVPPLRAKKNQSFTPDGFIFFFFSPSRLHPWGLQSLHRETFVLGVLRKTLATRGV